MNLSNSDSLTIVRRPIFVRRSLPELSQHRIVHGLMPPSRLAASSTENKASMLPPFVTNGTRFTLAGVGSIIELQIMPHALLTIPVEVRVRKVEATWVSLESKGASKLRCQMFDPQPKDEQFLDGWTIRDRFLRLRRRESDLLKFLQWAGRFPPVYLSSDYEASVFWEWQDIFREALLRKKADWKEGFRSCPYLLQQERSEIQFLLPGRKPKGIVQASCGLYAIRTTVELDLVSGAEFKWCARPDCPRRIFKPASRHQTKYCSYDCAHLQSIRNSRGTIVSSEDD